MSLSKDSTAMDSVAESLLKSISEIIESVTCIEQEKENFAEIGCYLYRVFPVIMELQTTEHAPRNVMEILQSLSKSITEVKYLVSKCQRGTNSNFDSELKSTISLLERAIQDMGECLTLIPSSAFQDQEYAEVAVQALSNEMRSAHFEVGQSQVLQTKELDPHESFSEEEPNEEPVMVVSDLYPVTLEVSRDNSLGLNTPHFIELQKPASLNRQRRKSSSSSNSSTSLLKMSEYVEPMYGAFFCPLTKQIMDDPVTVQSGVTYDRKAITEWLEESENSQEIFCPVTGQKLLSRVLRTNVALKTTIEEWKERNEVARIKCSRSALVLSASPSMVLEAIRDLHEICKRKQHNKIQVLNAGILPLLFKLLEYRDRDVSYEVLELLRELTKDDDDSKQVIWRKFEVTGLLITGQLIIHQVIPFAVGFDVTQSLACKEPRLQLFSYKTTIIDQTIAETLKEASMVIFEMVDISAVIKMVSTGHQPVRHAALLLLLEISRSQSLLKKIGSVPGGILMLIRFKYNLSVDAFSSEIADEILKNLERSPEKYQADGGKWILGTPSRASH
ncbi:hypothetical protein OIU78_005001 [Salix suchowensis]|nr:hypothetical protein OIU78_005001 [Salix suchowensis]